MAKVRIVVCGMFEDDSIDADLRSRAEFASVCAVKTMLTEGSVKGWSVGALDIEFALL